MTRRGFVLAAVLFALVLLGALTATEFFAALQEHRAGTNAASLLRAQAAATTALADAIAGWDPARLDSVTVGSRAGIAVTAVPGTTAVVEARRLSPSLFLLRATGTSGAASRAIAQVVRLRGFDFEPRAAVRVRSIDPAIQSRVSGVDGPPAGWNCAPVNDTITTVTLQSGASDSAFLRFGGRGWPEMVAWAMAAPAGGDSLGIQYWPHDLAIVGGGANGLLVVEGNLTLDGGAVVTGIVLVRGSLILRGTGGIVSGAVVASQVIAGAGYTPSGVVFRYSSCAVSAAAWARAWPEAIPGGRAGPIF